MWRPHITDLNDTTQQIALEGDSGSLSYAEVLSLWRDDPAFRVFFTDLLASAPFPAYFWETPALTRTAASTTPFACVLVQSPGLAKVAPSPAAFAEHFDAATPSDAGVVSFANLRGDARLVVPCPLSAASAYPHLAAFVRSAPEAQQHALWRRVGEVMEARLNDRPVWLSTAGMGVHWLHVRLDDRPKYYRHQPYKAAR